MKELALTGAKSSGYDGKGILNPEIGACAAAQFPTWNCLPLQEFP